MEIKPLILRSKDKGTAYKASAGGVVSEIIKYALKNKIANTSITFYFSGRDLYKPKIIYTEKDYNISGSIYHDINIYKFLKNNLHNIKSPIILTLLPCQVYPVKKLLEKNGIESIVISLFCSAQMSKEATYYLLNKNKINMDEVEFVRYRGNGWPSGLFVKTKSKEYFFHNNNSIWFDIFHSNIFTLKKCFHCLDTYGVYGDISIGDPWLKEYVENDNIGNSLVITLSKKGFSVIKDMIEKKELILVEERNFSDLILSQLGTIKKKKVNRKFYKLINTFNTIFRSGFYKNYIFMHFHRQHRFLLQKFYSLLYRLFMR